MYLVVTADPHPALRQFWIEASGAGHALGQIRKFAERWTSLFRSYSDLLILNEEDWLRSLTEFLDIDERLSEVLSKTVTEAGARSIDARQKVGGEPERAWPAESSSAESLPHRGKAAGPAFRAVTNSDQVASPADPKTKAAGDESNRNRIAVERINPSSTEPILVRGRFSITRAEARDYFEKISARRGLRAEWDTLIIATSDHEQTPAPHPDFRRLWIEASCAGHFMGKVQQVESEWSSLFGSTSELLIFHEEEVVGSLMELLGINESLAGVVARSGFDGRKDADAAVMRSGLRVDSPGPGGNEGASQLSQAARVSSESESVAAAEIRSNKTRAGSSPTTRKGIHRSPVESGRPLHRGGHSITRAEARAYVKNISDRLNAGSAWDRPVGARPGREQTYDLPILVREAAAAAGPQLFNSQDAVNHRPRDDNWASPSALTPQSDNTAGAANRRAIKDTKARRFENFDPVAHGAVPSEVRLDQVLNRLAADSIRPPRNSSRTRFANELTDSYRRARTGEAGRVTEDQSEPEVHFAPEVRLSGLQRLAQRGINIRTKRAVETERSAKADDGWRGIDEVAHLLPVASGDAAEFGLQLVELLRREALRHGIFVEGL